MNFVLHGYPVSGGITVGYAHLVSTARLEVAHYEVAEQAVDAERSTAMTAAQEELAALTHSAGSPAEFEAFLDLHRMILNDSALAQAPRELIRKRRANASGRWCSKWSAWSIASRRSTIRTCASARRMCSRRSSAC